MTQRSTLLVISQVFPPDAAAVGRPLADVAEEMSRRGWRVIVVTAGNGYEDPAVRYRAHETLRGVDVRRLSAASFGKATLAHRLLGGGLFVAQALAYGLFIRRATVVLVSTSPPFAGFAGAILAWLRGLPAVWWVMDLNPDQIVAAGRLAPHAWPVRLFDAMNRITLRVARRVIVLDRFMQQRVEAKIPQQAPWDSQEARGASRGASSGAGSSVIPPASASELREARDASRGNTLPASKNHPDSLSSRCGLQNNSFFTCTRENATSKSASPGAGRAAGPSVIPPACAGGFLGNARATGDRRHSTIHVIPPWSAARPDRWRPPWPNAFRAARGLDRKFVVMYAGNHALQHPLDTLLDAAAQLEHDRDVAFVFIGGGAGKAAIDARIRAGAANLMSLPFQPAEHLDDVLTAADVHVVSMGADVVGIVHPCKIYGALAVGRPVLFFGPPESPPGELLADLGAGCRVDHGNVAGAVEAIRSLRSLAPQTRAAMAQASAHAIATRFGACELCREVCDLIETSRDSC